MSTLDWKGQVEILDEYYEVEATLTIERQSDGDSSVPNGTRRWWSVEEAHVTGVTSQHGNDRTDKLAVAAEEWICEHVDAGKLVAEARVSDNPFDERI